MTKAQSEQATMIIKLLEYVECKPISEAFFTLNFWSFVISLSESYNKFGRLTEAQYNALVKIIQDFLYC